MGALNEAHEVDKLEVCEMQIFLNNSNASIDIGYVNAIYFYFYFFKASVYSHTVFSCCDGHTTLKVVGSPYEI